MYNFILLILFILIIFFSKDYKNIKIYSSLCCLLMIIMHIIINNNVLNQFSNSFAISIPFICLLCSLWIININIHKIKTFCISLISFCYCSIKAFTLDNIFLIYACIEISLIPMSIMLLYYKKNYNLKIVYQYLFYTFISSVFILIGLIDIYIHTNSVLLSEIYSIGIKSNLALYMLGIGTAIKLPIFPFYYWVPSVHGKSDGICSVLLSSIVLKFSSLILVKIILPLFNICNYKYVGYLISIGILISVCQMIYTKNLKIIFAYSSVVHMGLYTFILLSGNNIKHFTYSILQHTFTMALSFFALDLLKNKYKSLDFNKLVIDNKYELILLIISTLTIIDFPFTWGFIAETISIVSLVQYDIIIAVIVCISLLLYTSYLINITFIVFKNALIMNNKKLNYLQNIILILLIIINIIFGIKI